MPKAIVVYGTYGHLNAAHDNAILLPSHYMANHHGYEWLIGPGRALDTATMFLVATELFGNGHSSSPSNTPEPFHGPRFPVTTIRDNVDAVHRLLVDDLKITHLRAVIGFSMGAEQAFQWAVSYPDFADRIVATSGTAKTYGHGIVQARGPDRRAHRGSHVQRRRLHRAAEERHGGVRHGVGRVALLAGMVAARAVEDGHAAGNDVRSVREHVPHELSLGRGRQRRDPPGAHVAAAQRRRDARLRRRRRAGAQVDQGAATVHAVGDRPVFPA